MKISIKNVGAIRDADIELGDVTVLYGRNGTGRSTFAKLLDTIVNGQGDEKAMKAAVDSLPTNNLDPKEPLEIKLAPRTGGKVTLRQGGKTAPDLSCLKGFAQRAVFIDDEVLALCGLIGPETDLHGISVSERTLRTLELVQKSFDAKGLSTENEDPEEAQVRENLRRICRGRLVPGTKELRFADEEGSPSERIRSAGAGLRLFLLLQQLIFSGAVGRNDVLILDSPESSMHPDWQVRLAEVIILILESIGIRVIVISQSPYLIGAIEAYSVRWDVEDYITYAFARRGKQGVEIEDVTGDVAEIYDDLAGAFDMIQKAKSGKKIK
ncbi:AAA family ATPase [Sutterella sp.]|uniref:AAA family ATPase n=1 Tax=Sutterella sp. TaxID=1981025 RepID=UPI0026E0A256|nr:AAA family ATPase [Sutterella sp.]MDO5531878.1 AAA family ATPase [Sutterella sp.]